MAICIELKKLMKECDISLNAAVEIVGISKVNLSRIRTGRIVALRFETLDGLVDALQRYGMEWCDVGDIIKYVPESDLTDDDVVSYPVRLRDPANRIAARKHAGFDTET